MLANNNSIQYVRKIIVNIKCYADTKHVKNGAEAFENFTCVFVV